MTRLNLLKILIALSLLGSLSLKADPSILKTSSPSSTPAADTIIKNKKFFAGENSAVLQFTVPEELKFKSKREESIYNFNMGLRSFDIQMSSGGDVSGGGSSIRFPDKEPFLLDFIMLDPNFEEKNGFAPLDEKIFNVPLDPENIIQGLPIDLKQRFPVPYEILQKRLSLWEKNSPRTVGAIRSIIEKTSWKATVLGFKHLEDRAYPKHLNVDRTKVPVSTVSAVMQGYGVFILSSKWDSVLRGHTSRAGLIVHEALRTIQVEYSSRLANETIQKITAHIFLSDPKDFENTHLDLLLMKDIWFEDPWSTYSLESIKNHIGLLCRGHEILIEMTTKILNGLQPVYKSDDEQHLLNGMKAIDTVVADFLSKNPSFKEAAKGLESMQSAESLSELPVRSLNFWLDHTLDAEKVARRDIIRTDFLTGPIEGMGKFAFTFQKLLWDAQVHNLIQLKQKVCTSGKVQRKEVREFILLSRTLMKLVDIRAGKDSNAYYRNFMVTRQGLNEADKKFATEVYNEAVGARVCYNTKLKMNFTVTGTSNGPNAVDCKVVPKKHFKDKAPIRPRINLK